MLLKRLHMMKWLKRLSLFQVNKVLKRRLKMLIKISQIQGRRRWVGSRRLYPNTPPSPPPPTSHTHTNFNFLTKQGPPVSFSNIRDIAFYWCLEITRTRNFTILPCMLQPLDNFWWLFIFSNCITEIDLFTLDFLKRSDT